MFLLLEFQDPKVFRACEKEYDPNPHSFPAEKSQALKSYEQASREKKNRWVSNP